MNVPPNIPVITIFVRHAKDCKYQGDETCKRCDCRKHLRWTANGVQYRRSAKTRTWAEAERQKRHLIEQLSAGNAAAVTPSAAPTITHSVTRGPRSTRPAARSEKRSNAFANFSAFCTTTDTYTSCLG